MHVEGIGAVLAPVYYCKNQGPETMGHLDGLTQLLHVALILLL